MKCQKLIIFSIRLLADFKQDEKEIKFAIYTKIG